MARKKNPPRPPELQAVIDKIGEGRGRYGWIVDASKIIGAPPTTIGSWVKQDRIVPSPRYWAGLRRYAEHHNLPDPMPALKAHIQPEDLPADTIEMVEEAARFGLKAEDEQALALALWAILHIHKKSEADRASLTLAKKLASKLDELIGRRLGKGRR